MRPPGGQWTPPLPFLGGGRAADSDWTLAFRRVASATCSDGSCKDSQQTSHFFQNIGSIPEKKNEKKKKKKKRISKSAVGGPWKSVRIIMPNIMADINDQISMVMKARQLSSGRGIPLRHSISANRHRCGQTSEREGSIYQKGAVKSERER